ncbi:brefeldin A-inhibited guanine nucleotide-exchange protein 1-like [Xenia sp. Carnegie-2017]|uniref:brefeldin A-inhibited guanine nucleotide-exchange protein 1-like n=1 Tax=Xenia sp. Carnegie-2017 TaxID=2897299 RepID=UPI001F03DF4E|nr:brefeldin A-inhibited guanine nucleotide-exchange protein 1-like [Xenia sp. Carnegie-2017]XP_046857502.1 brefeldin A-inhibited guanine nucleotide-exchange protein 1-like [Xenia sp. Carnegie-2017]
MPQETVEETKEQDSISLHSTPSLRFEPVEEHDPVVQTERMLFNSLIIKCVVQLELIQMIDNVVFSQAPASEKMKILWLNYRNSLLMVILLAIHQTPLNQRGV